MSLHSCMYYSPSDGPAGGSGSGLSVASDGPASMGGGSGTGLGVASDGPASMGGGSGTGLGVASDGPASMGGGPGGSGTGLGVASDGPASTGGAGLGVHYSVGTVAYACMCHDGRACLHSTLSYRSMPTHTQGIRGIYA